MAKIKEEIEDEERAATFIRFYRFLVPKITKFKRIRGKIVEAKAKNPYQIHTRERWWLKGVSFDVAASLREFQEPSPEYILTLIRSLSSSRFFPLLNG